MIATTDTWFAAHSDSVFHFGFSEAGTHIDTGQPILQLFSTEDELAAYLGKITGDAEYYQKHKESDPTDI